MYEKKISFEIKQKAVTEIESGRLSQSEAARRLGINEKTIRRWMSKYRRATAVSEMICNTTSVLT